MKSIKAVLDKHFSSVRINGDLAKAVISYLDAFRTKNEEHIHFFGSNHFGTNKVVMSTADQLEWTIDILDLEEDEIVADMVKVPGMNSEWKKYMDVMNLSCVYLIHRFYNSSLPTKIKHDAMIAVAVVLNLKFLTSFVNSVVFYRTSEEIAEKTYDSLSYKYSLKKTGSWNAMLIQRAEDMIAPNSVHIETIKTFSPDKGVLYFISDPQTRIKSIAKNLYDQMVLVKEDETRRLKSSMMVEMDDGVTIRDVSGQFETYSNYIKNVLTDKNSFIKAEIADAVLGLMGGTLPPPVFSDALIKYYEFYNKKDKDCLKILDMVLQHAFDKIQKDKDVQKKASNVVEFLIYIHPLYTAARGKDDIVDMRILTDRFIKRRVKSNNTTVIAQTRTSLMLYIVARTLLMEKY